MDSIPDELHRELIGTKLKELLDKGFTIFDSSHNSTSLRKNEELEELISKNDITEELCGKYAFFRTLFDYKDGIFSVKDEKMMGKYLYKNRHELPYELVDSLFVFLGLNVIVKEKLAKQKDKQKKEVVKEKEDNNDPLVRFVFDDKEREKVREGLRGCQDTGQVAQFAKVLWREETMEYEVLRSTKFHRAILPLLSFETTEGAIKQAIIKQVK